MKQEAIGQFATSAQPYLGPGAYGVAADDLVKRHLSLVRKIAWHIHGRSNRRNDVEDLVQIGLMALIEAGRVYADQGFSFSTYASVRIRGAMVDYLRREMLVGRSSVAASRKIAASRTALEQRLHRAPTTHELATEMGLDPKEFLALEQLAARGAPLSIDDLETGAEFLADLSLVDIAEQAESADLAENLKAALTQLSEREQMVLQLYFHEELNLSEIGEVLDVSAARVCQIKAGAMAKLQELLQRAVA